MKDIGELHFTEGLKRFGTSVKLLSSAPTVLGDRTPANEMQFGWLSGDHWRVKTMILATYRDDKLIFATVTSLAHPEMLKEFLYSLQFE